MEMVMLCLSRLLLKQRKMTRQTVKIKISTPASTKHQVLTQKQGTLGS